MIVAIVQARTKSARLPNKVLMDICGKPMLERVLDRLCHSKLIDIIQIATTNSGSDMRIIDIAARMSVYCYCHSREKENDLLDRFYRARVWSNDDVVVRVTADCPCIDPELVDQTIKYFLDNKFDYVSNCSNYPDGFDTEVFSFSALEQAWEKATDPRDREHIGLWMVRNCPKVGSLPCNRRIPKVKLSVDTMEDLELIRKVFQKIGNHIFTYEEAIDAASNTT